MHFFLISQRRSVFNGGQSGQLIKWDKKTFNYGQVFDHFDLCSLKINTYILNRGITYKYIHDMYAKESSVMKNEWTSEYISLDVLLKVWTFCITDFLGLWGQIFGQDLQNGGSVSNAA